MRKAPRWARESVVISFVHIFVRLDFWNVDKWDCKGNMNKNTDTPGTYRLATIFPPSGTVLTAP